MTRPAAETALRPLTIGIFLSMTAVACFILAMPNRYLPILQEGHIGSLREKFQQKP